jgi:protein SCO1/2
MPATNPYIVRMPAPHRALVVIALSITVACREARHASTVKLHGLQLAGQDAPVYPSLRLVEDGGKVFDLSRERGKVVLLYFGYTNCPDVCPTTLADWARLRRLLGSAADSVRFVFVSIDPARDTPAAVRRYVDQFDHHIVGLSGDSAAIATAQREFHVRAFRDTTGFASGSYGMAHPAFIYLLDSDGRLRALYPLGGNRLADLEADIRTLLPGAHA